MSGFTVPGERSGSNSPPVVASLSPSSTSYLDHPHYNASWIMHHHQPTAPVATSALRPSIDANLTEHQSLREHQTHTAPASKTVSSTPHRFPMLAATSTSWESNKPAQRNKSIRRTHPKYSRSSSSVASEPTEERGTAKLSSAEVGGWANVDSAAERGVWGKVNHRPHFSNGRPDTFGHSITEDLSHLKPEHSQRRNGGREADQLFISHSVTDHSSSRMPGGNSYSTSPHDYPQGERVNFDQHFPRQRQSGESNVHNAGFPALSIPSGSIQEQNSRRASVSHQASDHTHEPGHERLNEPFHVDCELVDYILPCNNNQIYKTRVHDLPNSDARLNHPIAQNTGTLQINRNPLTTTSTSRRPLSIQEIVRITNMSNTDHLLLYLKQKHITFSQLLNFINRGVTKEEILMFLQKPDISTTHEPWLLEPESKFPQNVSLSTKTIEVSQLPESPESNSDVFFTESAVNSTIIFDSSDKQTALSTNPEDELNDEAVESTDIENEQRQRNRKKKNRDRQRGNGQRGKNERGKKNKGQRGKKGRQKALSDLVNTTVMLPVDDNTTISVSAKQFTVTEPAISNVSPEIPVSTLPSFSSQTTFAALPPEPSMKTFSDTTASRSNPNLAQIPLSVHSSTTVPSSEVAIKVELATTPVVSRVATPSWIQMGTSNPVHVPSSDSLPTDKNSEASILSVTLMELPADHKGKKTHETVPEDLRPKSVQRRPSNPMPQDMHRPHQEKQRPPKPVRKSPKHTSVSMLEQTETEFGGRTNFVKEQQKDDYIFPIKGILIISGVMGALAVFTLVVLISYAVIKCTKKPVVNNYQVSEQKPVNQ